MNSVRSKCALIGVVRKSCALAAAMVGVGFVAVSQVQSAEKGVLEGWAPTKILHGTRATKPAPAEGRLSTITTLATHQASRPENAKRPKAPNATMKGNAGAATGNVVRRASVPGVSKELAQTVASSISTATASTAHAGSAGGPAPSPTASAGAPRSAPGELSKSSRPESSKELDENMKKVCTNLAPTAADARVAWLQGEIARLEKELEKRIELLNGKIAETQSWLEKRRDYEKKATSHLVGIFSRMNPEAAAAQLAQLEEETAAAVLSKLDSKIAAGLLEEVPSVKAAQLSEIMAAAADTIKKGGPAQTGPVPASTRIGGVSGMKDQSNGNRTKETSDRALGGDERPQRSGSLDEGRSPTSERPAPFNPSMGQPDARREARE